MKQQENSEFRDFSEVFFNSSSQAASYPTSEKSCPPSPICNTTLIAFPHSRVWKYGFIFPSTPWKSLSLALQTFYSITMRKEALAKKTGLEKMLFVS